MVSLSASTSIKGLGLSLLVILAACSRVEQAHDAVDVPLAAVETADLLLVNGRIYTVDAERSWAEAVAIKDGRITWVGNMVDLENRVGEATLFGGKLVYGGLDFQAARDVELVQGPETGPGLTGAGRDQHLDLADVLHFKKGFVFEQGFQQVVREIFHGCVAHGNYQGIGLEEQHCILVVHDFVIIPLLGDFQVGGLLRDEGVLIQGVAELLDLGLVDGVVTGEAVLIHQMPVSSRR